MSMSASRPESVRDLEFSPKNGVYPSPIDWRDQVLYQLLIDRFDDGRDHPRYDPKKAKRGREREQGGIVQGGTLKGITRRLDYLKNLGCTAIWLSPPFKNRQDDSGSYHGYAIQDFLAVDPRFGTLEDLQTLVRDAHARGMYVILDIVINHTGDVWGYPNNEDKLYHETGRYDFGFWRRSGSGDGVPHGGKLGPDDGIWPVEFQDPDAFKRRGRIRDISGAGDEEAVSGDFFSLKELDPDNPKVVDALVQCYKYWIAVADVDGYRIDTVRNVEPGFASVFCNAIREYAHRIGKANFLIFGEIVGDDDLLRMYVGSNTPAENTKVRYPLFDACLDFPLYAVLDEVLKGQRSPQALWDRYESFRKYYRNFGEAARYYVTFVDNHDQGHRPFRRFLNGVDHDDRLGVLAAGYLLTNLGIPCLYYGTEQGLDGGGDSDVFVRETMFGGKWGAFDTTGVQFFNDKHPIYRAVASIANVRAAEPALRYGRQYFREVCADGKSFACPVEAKNTLAYSRILDTDEILVALNLDTEPRNDWVRVDPKLSSPGTKMVDLLNRGGEHVVEGAAGSAAIRIPLEGRSIAILKARAH